MFRRLAITAICLAQLSCLRASPLSLPFSEAESLILAVSTVEDEALVRLQLFALSPDTPAPVLTLSSKDTLYALAFELPLPRLGLEPGPLEPAPSANTSRPLPDWSSALQNQITRSGTDLWEPLELTALPQAISEFRLAAPQSCEGENACFKFETVPADPNDPDSPPRRREYCELPCAEPEPLQSPALPEPPMDILAVSCPDGWSERTLAGAATCTPPIGTRCGSGEALLPGNAGCAPLGPSCSAGAFPEDFEPLGQVLYVNSENQGAADGSAGAPYPTLEAALSASAGDRTLVLAGVVHAGGAILDGRVRIVGECLNETLVEGAGQTPALTIAQGAQVELIGVRLRGDPALEVQGEVLLQQAQLQGALGARVQAGGLLTIERSVIDQAEVGIEAEGTPLNGANLSLTQVRIEARTRGVRMRNSATSADRVAIDPVGGADVTQAGWWLQGSASLQIDESWVHATGSASAMVIEAGGQTTADQVYLSGGTAMLVQGQFTAARLAMDNAKLVVLGSSILSAQDLSIAHPEAIALSGTSSVTIQRARIEGLIDARERGQATIQDAVLLSADPAIETYDLASLTLNRATSQGAINFADPYIIRAVTTTGPDPEDSPRLNLRDVRVRPRPSDKLIVGLGIGDYSLATIQKLHISGARLGVITSCLEDCDVTADDITLEGTAEDEDGFRQLGGTLRLSRAHISGYGLYGMYAWGCDATIEDLVSEQIGNPDLDEADCNVAQANALRGPGSGLFVEEYANMTGGLIRLEVHARVKRFLLKDNRCSGLTTGFSGPVELEEGELSGNRWGINFLRGEPPESRLERSVRFRDNEFASIFSPVE